MAVLDQAGASVNLREETFGAELRKGHRVEQGDGA
jgi:hypothetical protein